MIAALSAWFGKWTSQIVVAAIIFLAAATLAFGAARALRETINDAVATAEKARDADWSRQIAEANEAAAKNIIEQMKASQAAQEKAQAEINRLNNKVLELEDANAALSDTPGSGIDVDRSRLLNNQFLGGKANPPY
ncbi:hypothetical protein F9L00_25015 [Brucella anthropi]|uniref:hypothetical protein n=1 Tax=Brucella/Ochrobactrum group TaxID=2826938 RepID=UPI00124D46A7|nr:MULTISPECIES: hypothetical protein [Brucella/Ochrobactrum group]KAB2772903.1 hypothetical protein F9L00_25015 [Brucella anthropi]MCQ9148392.1 hypothetical protein [Ochrobactrum sp. BTU2]NVM42035.1 hypothetical protein [Brucella intermedia]